MKSIILASVFFASFLILGLSVKAGLKSGADNYFSNDDNSQIEPYSFHRLFSSVAIQAYQRIISPSKGSSCPMHPHCSLYGRMAFRKYNPLKAFMVTSDRLHRCGHDLDNYELIEVDGYLRFYDPLPPTSNELPNPEIVDLELHTEIVSQQSGSGGGHDLITCPPSQDSLLYNFASQLQFDSDMDRAITEYRRLLSYYPSSSYREAAEMNLFDCYNISSQYMEAARWGRHILGQNKSEFASMRLTYAIGTAYFNVKNYRMATEFLSNVEASGDNAYSGKATMLKGLAFAYRKDFNGARETFQRVLSDSDYADVAYSNISLCDEGSNMKYKSPTVAGLLSVIPGLGYLYDGYNKTALSSSIVNSLFLWATYRSYDEGNPGLGTLLAVLSFGWYSGNIYGSIISAHRKNNKLDNDLMIKFNVVFSY